MGRAYKRERDRETVRGLEKERESESVTERIREQSDAGLTLTESLMKVRGDDWPGVYPDEVCLGNSCRGDLGLQRTDSDSSGISNWLHGQQPDSVAHIWT